MPQEVLLAIDLPWRRIANRSMYSSGSSFRVARRVSSVLGRPIGRRGCNFRWWMVSEEWRSSSVTLDDHRPRVGVIMDRENR